MFYQKKDRSADSPTILVINNETTLTKNVTGLAKYTGYEFQVLAFTSVGDGPTSSVKVERTKEDGKRHVIKCYKPYYTCLPGYLKS